VLVSSYGPTGGSPTTIAASNTVTHQAIIRSP
jgi:hypothetical protein